VINAFYLEEIERLGNVTWGPLLTRVRDGQKTFAPCPFEYRCKFGGRMACFRRVQADGCNRICMWKRLLEGLHGVLGTQMPQKAEYEAV